MKRGKHKRGYPLGSSDCAQDVGRRGWKVGWGKSKANKIPSCIEEGDMEVEEHPRDKSKGPGFKLGVGGSLDFFYFSERREGSGVCIMSYHSK